MVVWPLVRARVLKVQLGREGAVKLLEEVEAQAQSLQSLETLASGVGALEEQVEVLNEVVHRLPAPWLACKSEFVRIVYPLWFAFLFLFFSVARSHLAC